MCIIPRTRIDPHFRQGARGHAHRVLLQDIGDDDADGVPASKPNQNNTKIKEEKRKLGGNAAQTGSGLDQTLACCTLPWKGLRAFPVRAGMAYHGAANRAEGDGSRKKKKKKKTDARLVRTRASQRWDQGPEKHPHEGILSRWDVRTSRPSCATCTASGLDWPGLRAPLASVDLNILLQAAVLLFLVFETSQPPSRLPARTHSTRSAETSEGRGREKNGASTQDETHQPRYLHVPTSRS